MKHYFPLFVVATVFIVISAVIATSMSYVDPGEPDMYYHWDHDNKTLNQHYCLSEKDKVAAFDENGKFDHCFYW